MVGPLEFAAPKPVATDEAPLVAAAVGSDELAEPVAAADRGGAPTLPRLREYKPTDADLD